jgi:fructokinase
MVCLGEVLMDLFARPGVPLRSARTLYPTPGGAPANVAVALARLGADVAFVGKVGRDEYGAYLTELLAGEGVDTRHVLVDPIAPTMLSVVASPSRTEQQFLLHQGANALLRVDELPRAAIEATDTLVYGSISLSSPTREAARAAAGWARAAGRRVIFDVNLRPALWPDLEAARADILPSLTTASVVKLNERELSFLTGTDDLAGGARRVLAQGPSLCCVSLGAQGSYFATASASGPAPGFAVTVRDTLGSGDAFVAGLTARLSELDAPPEQLDAAALRAVLRFANACGALAATRRGGIRGMPRRAAVERLLRATG